MKSLATLIRLAKMKVDEQRVLASRLRAHLEQIESAIAALEIRLAAEQLVVQKAPDMALTYTNFVQRAAEQGRELEKQRATAANAVRIAEDRLLELFEEQKRYELAEARRLEDERREEDRRETVELDEIGAVTHTRRERQEKR